MFRRKNKQNTTQQRKVKSVYCDEIIVENSLAKCECEIFLPEPNVRFGMVKGNYLYRDSGTVLLGKNCMLYLCKVPVPYNPSETTLLLKDIGQENEVYLHIALNRHNEDLVYKIQNLHWHECKRKVNNSWRTFVLKFHDSNSEELVAFNNELEAVIAAIETDGEDIQDSYLLVAIQLKDQTSSDLIETVASSPEDRQFVIPLNTVPDLDQTSQSRASTVSNNSSKTSDSDAEVPGDSKALEPEFSYKPLQVPPPVPPPCEGIVTSAPVPCEKVYDPVYDPNPPSIQAPFDPAPFEPWTFAQDFNTTTSFTGIGDKSVTESGIKPRELSDLCDSLHLHPKELPKRLASILNSLGSDTDRDNQRLDSQHLISEELYIQMGVEKKMLAPSSPSAVLQEAMKIARSLQTAINEGDQQIAIMNAARLAAIPNITVTVDVKEKSSQQEEKDPLFSLKVYIEDKDTSGGSISLKVRASDTIWDLKQRMSFKHQFPEEIQSWIIGKRIPADHETLAQCKIKGPDHSAYLYLRSAKSVGLTRQAYQKRWNEQFNPAGDGSPVIGENQVRVPPPMPHQKADPTYMEMNAVQRTPSLSSAGSQPASREPSTATPPFKQTPNIKQEAKGFAENLNTPIQKGSKPKQVVQGGVRDHSQIPEDHPLELTGPGIQNILQGFSDFSEARAQQKSSQRVPVMHPEDEPTIGWVCSACTYINKPTRPGCEVCTQTRPPDYKIPENYVLSPQEKDWLEKEARLERQTKEAEDSRIEFERIQSQQNYMHLQQTDARDLVPNTEEFTCTICYEDVPVGEGVVLRNCLHHFCRGCLADHVGYSEDPVLLCPFVDDSYSCGEVIQDREVRALVPHDIYDRYLARSLQTAETQAKNSFHCKTADCPGWCIYEDHVNFFVCPVCRKENCLTCKAIHQGINCKQYQDDLQIRAANDTAANKTQTMIKKMVDDGDAMPCPQCQVIVMKKEGCDWIQCSICKTEICWVTKGPRWGPLGSGDTTGGCRCRVDGQPCHPDCNNCH